MTAFEICVLFLLVVTAVAAAFSAIEVEKLRKVVDRLASRDR